MPVYCLCLSFFEEQGTTPATDEFGNQDDAGSDGPFNANIDEAMAESGKKQKYKSNKNKTLRYHKKGNHTRNL